MAAEKKITCLEAAILFCKDNGVDPADIGGKVNRSLRDKIAQDARQLNYMPQQASLDL